MNEWYHWCVLFMILHHHSVNDDDDYQKLLLYNKNCQTFWHGWMNGWLSIYLVGVCVCVMSKTFSFTFCFFLPLSNTNLISEQRDWMDGWLLKMYKTKVEKVKKIIIQLWFLWFIINNNKKKFLMFLLWKSKQNENW